MIQSMYTGSNGLRSQQFNLDVIANNIANIGTAGFKNARADFKDALYNRMINPVENGEQMNLQHGTGVIPMQANHIFQQGAVQTTDRPLDFMINGDGFFTVEAGEGEMLYTRAGNFEISNEDEGAFLVTAQGNYVLDQNGERVMLQGSPSQMKVSEDGTIVFFDENGDPLDEGVRLNIVTFTNPVGLEAAGGNYFRETDNSGTAEPMETPDVRNYVLEASNVELAQEITRMVRAQRAYQLASRCVTTADQMAGLANSIRQ